uniref:Uncharacterized protein n=1 Tax=Anguilla anguilla TaxID=7936 RepID=A0A0E9XAE0_ANGAN
MQEVCLKGFSQRSYLNWTISQLVRRER